MCAIRVEPRILTERLLLRPPQQADAGRIAALANDLSVAAMLVTLPHPYTREDAEAFILALSDPLERNRVFAIEHPCDGLIGMVGFHRRDDLFPEVGYWLGSPYWGRGYATEALKGALGWAEREGARAVLSSHFEDNPASEWVLVKAGFLHTGEVRQRESLGRGRNVASRMMVWLA